LAGFIRRHPVFPPFATPSYSNAAFAILGFVVEAVTNKTYEAALEESVLKPLNLTRTSVRVPADSDGNSVILDAARWRWDLDVENP
jgi:CubicO group peptidase (beta-lactamase class C family)